MGQGRRRRVGTLATGVGLIACLAGTAGGSAQAQTADETTTTSVPANETRILLIEPASTTTTPPPAPTSPPAAARPTATTRTTGVPAVAADTAAVSAAAKAAAEERARLDTEIAGLEPHIAAIEAALVANQEQLSAGETHVRALEVRLAQGRSELSAAELRVAQLEASAASAAEAGTGRSTPVARPPTRGHSPRDQAALARQHLAAAADRAAELRRAVPGLEQELEAARQSTGGLSSELRAKIDELQRGREALARLREQLAAAVLAAPSATAPTGEVTLVPAPSALASATIPAPYLALYGRAAGSCTGLSWRVLAAVGSVESGHGQSTAVGVHRGENYAGAMGPMQFIAGTWAAYGVDGDGDGTRDVYNATDAVFGAANYLCASGAGTPGTLRKALWAYNHADWYVELVLELAARY